MHDPSAVSCHVQIRYYLTGPRVDGSAISSEVLYRCLGWMYSESATLTPPFSPEPLKSSPIQPMGFVLLAAALSGATRAQASRYLFPATHWNGGKVRALADTLSRKGRQGVDLTLAKD
ncbi:hypothetical protein [Streptomyces goshikiensis]|uniref:hypothetical protein n=1 Tax=Streptomyces goshikiensis TaxID=1942 RepID=UPI00364C4076